MLCQRLLGRRGPSLQDVITYVPEVDTSDLDGRSRIKGLPRLKTSTGLSLQCLRLCLRLPGRADGLVLGSNDPRAF